MIKNKKGNLSFLIYFQAFIFLGISCFLLSEPVEAANSVCKRPIIVAYTDLVDPWYIKEANGNITGIDIELIRAILDNIGCSIKVIEQPWARQLLSSQKGKLDIILNASKKPEREKYAYFSDYYLKTVIVLYVRKGESQQYPIQTLSDITKIPFKLGVFRKAYYGKEYEELLKNPNFKSRLDTVTSHSQNPMKLQVKRIDGYLASTHQFEDVFIEMSNAISEIHQGMAPSSEDKVYYMLSKKSTIPELVQAINQSMAQLKARGGL